MTKETDNYNFKSHKIRKNANKKDDYVILLLLCVCSFVNVEASPLSEVSLICCVIC